MTGRVWGMSAPAAESGRRVVAGFRRLTSSALTLRGVNQRDTTFSKAGVNDEESLGRSLLENAARGASDGRQGDETGELDRTGAPSPGEGCPQQGEPLPVERVGAGRLLDASRLARPEVV